MKIKSYEVQKNQPNLFKYNFFLLYGENFGLKKDLKDIIKLAIGQKNESLEILSIYESEIIDDEENFYNSIYSGSFFKLPRSQLDFSINKFITSLDNDILFFLNSDFAIISKSFGLSK